MSESPQSPATPGADKPAAGVPDDTTAVHPTGGEPAGSQSAGSQPTGGEPTGGEPTSRELAGTQQAPATEPVDSPSGGARSPIPGVVPDPVVPAATASDAPAWTPPAPPQESSSTAAVTAFTAERPEVAVGAAFAGGLVLALILKRLAR